MSLVVSTSDTIVLESERMMVGGKVQTSQQFMNIGK